MSSAPTASLLVLLTLAVVLVVSAAAKLREPLAFEDAFVALRVPSSVPRRATSRVVPWVEVVLGALLLVAPSPLLVGVGVVVAGLMAVYTALVARALTFDEPVDCACFGSLGSHQVGRLTLVRNLLLLGLATTAVGIGLSDGSAPGAAADFESADWWALVAALAAVVVTVTIVGGQSARAATSSVEPELDYERRPIPYGVLAMPDGTTTTLAELAATQARLLVVLNPHCGPCVRTAEKLDAWADRLGPAVGVVAVHPEAGLVMPHREVLTAVEPAHNVRRVFSVGTPGAVLLGADGLLAGGPVAGAGSVERFVDEILDELEGATPAPSS
ncbi:MauE/DoxX family redox-associated membrane protein [Microbacterium sp. ARD31]|uniref:TlpA family protein disulfide reductase n=1 Tax=Microbacterium sp. ARD31 TaxID=2962576 RepID=UPI00288233ED|nr:MauE/DoxX family redox-associated membrane protein [Microbacterium sp. ARD31]MDT0183425.1 MauE/DoxX family redox-associated membrane protein [Microbacterium sp. ARD31]